METDRQTCSCSAEVTQRDTDAHSCTELDHTDSHLPFKQTHTTSKQTCSVLAVGPHQVLAFGHNHSQALCCWQIAERQQDLPDCIHSLRSQTFNDITSSVPVPVMI